MLKTWQIYVLSPASRCLLFFKGKFEARKSLKAFFLEPKLQLNILQNVFFLFAVKKCLKAFKVLWAYIKPDTRSDHKSQIFQTSINYARLQIKINIKYSNDLGLPVEMQLLKAVK